MWRRFITDQDGDVGGQLDNVAPVLISEVFSAYRRLVFFIVISLSFFIIALLLSGGLRAVKVTQRSAEGAQRKRNSQIGTVGTAGQNQSLLNGFLPKSISDSNMVKNTWFV